MPKTLTLLDRLVEIICLQVKLIDTCTNRPYNCDSGMQLSAGCW